MNSQKETLKKYRKWQKQNPEWELIICDIDIDTSKKCTLFFPHYADDGNTTTYTLTTPKTIPSNFTLVSKFYDSFFHILVNQLF